MKTFMISHAYNIGNEEEYQYGVVWDGRRRTSIQESTDSTTIKELQLDDALQIARRETSLIQYKAAAADIYV